MWRVVIGKGVWHAYIENLLNKTINQTITPLVMITVFYLLMGTRRQNERSRDSNKNHYHNYIAMEKKGPR